jgi:hypothetical protein
VQAGCLVWTTKDKNDKGGQDNDKPGCVFHCNLIPADYAKVMVLDHIEDHFGFFFLKYPALWVKKEVPYILGFFREQYTLYSWS